MELQIREATLNDAQDIAGLNRNDLGYEYSVQETKEKLNKVLSSVKDKVFVAVLGDVVVGYVHANDYDVLYAPHMKNIMGIAVSGELRRCGIGKALLASVEEWAKGCGAAGVRLVSGAGRTEAHEFYRRCGYGGGKQQVNFKKIFRQ